MTASELESLRTWLTTLGTRQIPPEQIRELERRLSQVWDNLEGACDSSMKAYKLHDRMEGAEWADPVLEFDIERHGSTVQGSPYADIQHWSVNLRTGVATRALSGRKRQVRKKAAPLDVRSLAKSVFTAITAGSDDPRLVWKPDGSVRVKAGEVISAEGVAKQTLQSRRKRFRERLETELAGAGWKPKPGAAPHTYERNSGGQP